MYLVLSSAVGAPMLKLDKYLLRSVAMALGYFCLVLHSHIPYTKKAGKWPFGEEWLYEAMAETYIPILDILAAFTGSSRVCVSISPVLMEQLKDPYMNDGFKEYLQHRLSAAKADVARFAATFDHRLRKLAEGHVEYYEKIRDSYVRKWNCDLVQAFRRLQDSGRIEAITTAATHAYLPLMNREMFIRMQLLVGREVYRAHMGTDPVGIWLPECGYRPGAGNAKGDQVSRRGIEQYLQDLGIRYFLVDSHAIEGGEPLGIYSAQLPAVQWEASAPTGKSTFRPYYVEGSGVAVFGRDRRTGSQVWSSEWGYPGDGSYREFHKRDEKSGLRYWRVTNRLTGLDRKELYDPDQARTRIDEQSDHFVRLVRDLLAGFAASSDVPGVLVAPYDIEFFGHWWYEGPEWLRQVLIKLESIADVEVSTPGIYLQKHPPTEAVRLRESSWGAGGKHHAWMNHATTWLWKDLADAESRLIAAIERYRNTLASDPHVLRLINQAIRELMLMQSSDWPFLITTGQAADYAKSRFIEHKERLDLVLRAVEALSTDRHCDPPLVDLDQIEHIDSLFSDLNLSTLVNLS